MGKQKGKIMRKDGRDRKKYDDDYYQRNKERKKEYARQRRLLLGTKVLAEQQRKYYQRNPHMMAYKKALRRSRKRLATPEWSDLETIKEIYKNCPSNMTVDHIIPITSPLVCGLHVSWNMEYLSRSDNSKKGNSFSS